MHVFQCGWCRSIHYSYFPPQRHISPDKRLIDVVPVYCTCRTPIRMYYLGMQQPAPMPMQFNANSPAFQPTPRQPNNQVHAAPPQPNAVQRQPDPVPAPTRYAIQDLEPEHYDAALKLAMSYMDEKDVLAFRVLNHAHRDLAERVMKGWFTPDRFKYAASGLMNMETFIKQQIDLAQSVRVSVDQLTHPDLLKRLVGFKSDELRKVKGVNAGRLATDRDDKEYTFDQTFGAFSDRSALIDLPGNEKMHNKFYLVGGQGVITGSPNLSNAGLKDNQECIVFIRHPMVAILFREYFERIRSDGAARLRNNVVPPRFNGPEPKEFENQIRRFNDASPVRVALAPFLNIRDFVYEELQGATGAADVKITMRQFMVDKPSAEQKDILNALMKLSRERADVTAVLDYSQYCKFGFIKDAVRQLKAAGVTVYLQKSGKNIMHEKLLLIQFKKNNKITKTALLGSAGFTKNVSENLNYENIIAIDEDQVYDYFMQWHVDSITPARKLSTTYVVGAKGPPTILK